MRRLCALLLLLLSAVLRVAPASAQVEQPTREDAINNPHKHAWSLFLALNHPAKDPKIERGAADPAKKIGDPGLTVWETWKHAGSEVFLPDGSKPRPWHEFPDEAIAAKTLEVPKPVLLRAFSQGISVEQTKAITLSNMRMMITEAGAVDPGEGEFSPDNFSGGGETRMNKSTFEFIVDDNNQLYNIEGQEKFFEDVAAGNRKPMSFPVDSIEVKAMWIAFSPEDLQRGKDARYHVGKDKDGKLYGLVAFHIITKDIPNWFWASFHHVDGKKPLVPPQDSHGRPSLLNGTKWQNYALSGTQTDFIDSTGRATLLSDPHIENGFERSSCISCHAQATIGARQQTGANRLPVFQIQRTTPDFIRPPPGFGLPANFAGIGAPYPDQYFDARGRVKYIQLDFLYSLHIRANRKSQ